MLTSLTLAQQVAQMIVVRASGYLFDHQIRYPIWEPPAATLRHWLEDLGVGGVILLGGSAGELSLRTQQLQDWATIPLLICADVEEGVGQRFSGATWFPPPMALAAIAQHDLPAACHYAQHMGTVTAKESLAIGLNWLLSPTVDVNNNPDNPVINVRAFGETAQIVSKLATAFIRGAHSHSILTTAKHFPGHGDTAVDSHLELPILGHDRSRLEQVEFPPFQAAIQSGVDAVMSAHLQIPALDAHYPATLSPKVLTQELRQRMGFEGLIVTDALVMGAIANRYGTEEAAVLAVEAGADILLMPLYPEKAIEAVCAAVESGRIAPEKIEAAIERIWRAKQKVCSPIQSDTPHAWKMQSVAAIDLSSLGQSDARLTCTEILKKSQKVHRSNPCRLDVPTQGGRNLILVDDLIDCDFLTRTAPAIAFPAQFGFTQVEVVDRHTPKIQLANQESHPTLLQLFIRGNPFRGSAGLTQTARDWFDFLLKSEQLQGLVIYGSPYILEQFVLDLPSNVPYVFSYGQMPLAQAIGLEALLESRP